MFFQTIKFSYLVVAFTTNNKAFTEKYCANKSQPEMNCKGKCHLDQEVSKISESSPSFPFEKSASRFFSLEILFFQEVKVWNGFVSFLAIDKKINSFYLNNYSAIFITKLFHPPQNILFLR
jgi:hypothetical protein